LIAQQCGCSLFAHNRSSSVNLDIGHALRSGKKSIYIKMGVLTESRPR
jgi:hypothetical protein